MKKNLLILAGIIVTSLVPLFTQAAGDGYSLGQWWFWWQTTIFNPDVPDAENFEENVAAETWWANSLLNTLKIAINRVLGLLAFIALLFLLYGGFKILIAGTDDAAVGEAQTIVKNAAYGILFIALSWIIVTFIFYIAALFTEDKDTNTTTNSITKDQIDPAPTQISQDTNNSNMNGIVDVPSQFD